MSSQQEYSANLIPILENDCTEMIPVISGRKCLSVYSCLNPGSSFLKTFLKLILQNQFPSSKRYVSIWKVLGTKHRLFLKFRLSVSAPRITGTVSGLLPTPKKSDGTGGGGSAKRRKPNLMNLRDWTKTVFGYSYPRVDMTELIMGYPEGWTDLQHSGIQLSLK